MLFVNIEGVSLINNKYEFLNVRSSFAKQFTIGILINIGGQKSTKNLMAVFKKRGDIRQKGYHLITKPNLSIWTQMFAAGVDGKRMAYYRIAKLIAAHIPGKFPI